VVRPAGAARGGARALFRIAGALPRCSALPGIERSDCKRPAGPDG